MGDKELLEEMKDKLNHIRGILGLVGDQDTVNMAGDLDSLIDEQAERVEGLERKVKVDSELFDKVVQQNKRLTDGIELAMKETDCDNTWDFLGRLLEGREKTDLPYRMGYKEESE